MKHTEFEQMTEEALRSRLVELKQEYFMKRSMVRSGQEKNSAVLGGLRRTIARGMTKLAALKEVKA